MVHSDLSRLVSVNRYGIDTRQASQDRHQFHAVAKSIFHLFTRWRKICGSDETATFVYFALILSLSAEYIAGSTHFQYDRKDAITAKVSASSLSEMTGVPRETVRRKLTILMREQLITRNSDGSYSLSMTPDEIIDFIRDSGLTPTRSLERRDVGD